MQKDSEASKSEVQSDAPIALELLEPSNPEYFQTDSMNSFSAEHNTALAH